LVHDFENSLAFYLINALFILRYWRSWVLEVSIELVVLRHVEVRRLRVEDLRGAHKYLCDVLASSVCVSFPVIQLARHRDNTSCYNIAVSFPLRGSEQSRVLILSQQVVGAFVGVVSIINFS